MVSRQRSYQIRMALEGRCSVCGQPLSPHSKHYCPAHHLAQTMRNRRRRRNRKIPLHSPLRIVHCGVCRGIGHYRQTCELRIRKAS